jgi:DNA-binding IscR family transcriptional regulator
VDCIDDPEGCPRSEYCECRPVYDLINRRVSEVLDEFSLADLVSGHRMLAPQPPQLTGELVTVGGEVESD